MLFSDRNVYRPGEELHLEALVRDWGEQGLRVPAGLTGRLDCVDARGRQFFQTNAAFSPSGGWSAPIQLPGASRGTYSARLHLGTNEYPYAFQVQDFQPNAFEIPLQSKPALAAGESIAVPVSARYLFGKALSRAQVKWWLEAEDMEFKPEGFDSFSFRRTELRPGLAVAAFRCTERPGTLGGSSNSSSLPTCRSIAPLPSRGWPRCWWR